MWLRMWLLKDGRCFTRPDAFLRVLVGEGECIGTQEAVLDEDTVRVIEKWVLDGVEFFTSYDKTDDGSTDRRVLMSVDLDMQGCIPKERWVVVE